MEKPIRPFIEVTTDGTITHNMANPPESFILTLHGKTRNTRIPVKVAMTEGQARTMLQHIVDRYAVGADIFDWERVHGKGSVDGKPNADRYVELRAGLKKFIQWYYCQEDDPEEILASLGDMLAQLIDEDPGKLWDTREEGRDFYAR